MLIMNVVCIWPVWGRYCRWQRDEVWADWRGSYHIGWTTYERLVRMISYKMANESDTEKFPSCMIHSGTCHSGSRSAAIDRIASSAVISEGQMAPRQTLTILYCTNVIMLQRNPQESLTFCNVQISWIHKNGIVIWKRTFSFTLSTL